MFLVAEGGVKLFLCHYYYAGVCLALQSILEDGAEGTGGKIHPPPGLNQMWIAWLNCFWQCYQKDQPPERRKERKIRFKAVDSTC